MRDIEKEFKAAFEDYSQELFRHAALRMSDRERSVELVQETFIKVWEYVRKGEIVHEYRSFLYRTLKNLIIDEYRKKKAVSLEGMLNEYETVDDLLPPDESNTVEAAIVRFEGVEVLQSVQKLPPLYKEVVLLRYVEGLTPQEIAQELQESENVVSVRIHRALKKLKLLLDPQ